MKLVLSSFFVYLFFVCSPVFAERFFKEYVVKVSGIKIGKLFWKINIENTSYSNEIKLKSEGLLSALYRFEGDYYSEGVVDKKKLKPTRYKHSWKTNKTTKEVDLVFNDEKLISLKQKPIEKEHLRINIFDIRKNKDPLTSFLQIMLGEQSSMVVDGRRTYTMTSVIEYNANKNIIEISNYSNLWADHKRNKFEKLTFEKKDGIFLPYKIYIYFDGRIFKLEQI